MAKNNFEDSKTISPKDWILNGVLAWLKRYSKLPGYAFAFLIGIFINSCSDSTVKGLWQVLNRMFNIHERPINILSWAASLVALISLAGRFLIERYTNNRTYEKRLATLYHNRINKSLHPFYRGHIGWGIGLTLQPCPNLQDGWTTKEVEIEYEPISYTFPPEIDKCYHDYMKEEFWRKYTEDRPRLMLVENPAAFFDMLTLRLKVQKTTWSQFQFYHKWILENSEQRNKDIERAVNIGKIDFPNSLCLHLIIMTKDNKVLLTKTGSKKGGDYHGVWALSIGEQLDPRDLEGNKDYVLNWVRRALDEELGISNEDFVPENVRVLAVNLEGDINNFALATIVVLNIDSQQVDAKIKIPKRSDSVEMSNWEFMDCDDMPKELIKPTRTYHLSTGIRMLYASLFKFGAPGLHRRLLRLEGKKGF